MLFKTCFQIYEIFILFMETKKGAILLISQL